MASKSSAVGVLLLNVGTPDAPEARPVRRYLREFLSDPRVLDIHPVARWLVLNAFILPFRPARSAAAYRRIWTKDGSPLLAIGKTFRDHLQHRLGDGFLVRLGMRYGRPSLASALAALRDEQVDRIVVFPLFPQYASSTTGTGLERVFALAGAEQNVPALSVVPPFYDHPGFIRALTAVGSHTIEGAKPDHVLFSFHGLPERQILKTGGHCLRFEDCCARIDGANRNCYRAQCFETARLLAAALRLGGTGWSVSFQSRLGRDPWIRPYTEEEVLRLAGRGARRLAVFCPAFVADCLETLEEIGIELREDFRRHGGEELRLVPSLNSDPLWIEAARDMVRRAAGLLSGNPVHARGPADALAPEG